MEDTLAEVALELKSARRNFPAIHSAHEGYAVLKEEVDELWEEVKGNKDPQSYVRMRKEAIQVAAMAIRLIEDVLDHKVYRAERGKF